MGQRRLKGWSSSKSGDSRGASSTVLLRRWNAGQAAATMVRVAFSLAVAATLAAVAPRSAAAQKAAPQRSTRLQQPADSVLCDTAPVKLVRRTPVRPKAAGYRRKVVHRKVTTPVVRKPRPAVAKAAGHRARPKAVAPRKPNCVRPAAAAVVPTPEAKQALVAALPWTAPAPVEVAPMPELSPFSLPGTIGPHSNAWALGLAGLSAFYFIGHDRDTGSEIVPPPPPPPPTVTPEPASIALLATGLVAIGAGAGFQRRRRNHDGRR